MNDQEIQAVIDRIAYKDWGLVFTTQHQQYPGQRAIYWLFQAPCVNSGMLAWQYAAPWVLPNDITEDGLVRLAFRAAKQAEEHECAENFHYKRKRVFDPHASVL